VESRSWPFPESQADKTPVKEPAPLPQILPPVTILPPVATLPSVAILLSDDVPAYRLIADELEKRLPDSPEIFSLQGDSAASAQAIGKLNDSGRGHIVAIGPLAAQAASRLTDRQVTFCQVFNYQDQGLTAAHMRGVSILPPAELQFRAWKSLDAGLQRVGVITGPGHEALIARARRAAQSHGIELTHRTVHSDKEMLYNFKRLTPEIQGLWLLPDDRILSRRVLRDTMEYSSKHRKQVLVFHPQLLQLGGLMSVSAIPADVAEQVIAALHASSARTPSSTSDLLPLTGIHVEVNDRVAQQLKISVTPGLGAIADVP
jgi:ABC-type uncharacterized transport system substrate-binding protein